MRLREIAEAVAGRVVGDETIAVERIVHPLDARPTGDLAVALADDARALLPDCRAEAVVVSAKAGPPAEPFRAVLVAPAGRATLGVLSALFDPGPTREKGVHPTAVIAPDAVIGAGTSIGPYAVIGPRSRIGAGSVVLAHVTIGADVDIGDQVLLHPGVRIGDGVSLGQRVIIHDNAVIGSDGFSFEPGQTGPGNTIAARRIHSVGRVIIGDDVEIGANTTIDRATLRATRIGRGTKIDNLVQIAHNVEIGEDCLICGLVGIAGSVRIGDRAMLAGGVGVADHVTIGADAKILAGSGVGSSIPAGAMVSGYPAMKHERTVDGVLYLGRQKALHGRVDALESRLRALESGKTTKES